MKAEIQVRTLAEHAWADFAHDLTYKSAFDLPEHWQREIALMAADLEDVDRRVTRIEEGLETYASSYGSYLSPEELAAEIETLETVLEFDPDDERLAARIGKLAMTAGDWDRAIAVMGRFVVPEHPERAHPPLLRDLGVSLAKRRREPDDLLEGRRFLQAAVDLASDDGDAIASLAGTWRGEDDDRARLLYRQAFEADPTDYYPLLNYVDLELERTGTSDVLAALGPMMAPAKTRCRGHIEVGVNIPWALHSMGKFALLAGDPHEALEWYSLGIRASTAPFMLPDLESPPAALIEGSSWSRLLVLLARATRFADMEALERVRTLATDAPPLESPVLIVAGGTDPSVEARMAGFSLILEEAMRGFTGTVVSGGTRQGICGLVGEFGESAGPRLHTIGYLPAHLPEDADRDDRYREIRVTAGDGFSPLEPLQNWIDVVASGIDPADVTVLGVNGGRIAAVEYRIALALGARVGIVEGSGREAARLVSEGRWDTAPNLTSLPMDPQTIRAFVSLRAAGLDPDVRESLGRGLHRIYLDRIAESRREDPARAAWDDLPADLRASNLAQAEAIAEKFEAIGCSIRRAAGDPVLLALTDEEIEILAEMEHGRWNAERLAAGWRWGPYRDPDAGESPYLVPWADLPDPVREHDRVFVRHIPDLLASVGLEAVRDR
jgi:tetratricopeptide (TPR) repeat protein